MKKFVVFDDDYCGSPYAVCKTRGDAEEFILSMLEEEIYIAMNEDINLRKRGDWLKCDNLEEWYDSFDFTGGNFHANTKWGNLLCAWGIGGGLAIAETEELD